MTFKAIDSAIRMLSIVYGWGKTQRGISHLEFQPYILFAVLNIVWIIFLWPLVYRIFGTA